MAGNDRWNLNRVGRAAAATTVSGRPPAYGLAVDLGVGTSSVQSTDDYNRMMRDLATRTATQQLQETSAYQTELQSAQRYQSTGLFLPDDEIMADGSSPGWSRLAGTSGSAAENIMSGINLFEAGVAGVYNDVVGGGLRDSVVDVLGLGDESDAPDNSFAHYRALKGILSEEDFSGLDERTRAYLVRRAEAQQATGDFLAAPGIKQGIDAFIAAYRGAQTPFIMAGRHGLVGGEDASPITGVDPMWFKGSAWADAWRKSQNQSLGNAIVDSILQPYVAEEKLDRWKRDNAAYQLSSLGVELGAAWYADPGVIAGRGVGTAARFSRGELPLNERGRAYRATQQALRREQITVGGLTGRIGQYNAKRINSRWDDVADFARTRSFSDFANLRMFRHRDIDGQAAAAALYWAFREAPESGVQLADFAKRAPGEGVDLHYPDVPQLTQQLLHGDPKAYEDFERLKLAAPEELDKFAPGAQTFIDAIEATKTKIPQLQKEMEDLEEAAAGGQLSLFHDWSIHTEIDRKARDIEEADEALSKYAGYGEWLDAMNNNPKVSQVRGKDGPAHRLFMDNQFGKMHAVTRYTRSAWIKKANTAEMHDVDSGAMSIRRQFEQFDHLFGYQDLDALDGSLRRWITAGTSGQRYEVMREIEETHLVNAAAKKFDLDPEVIRVIYDKVVAEQNKTLDGYRKGQESIFSTAPDLSQRLEDPGSDVGLVARDAETGMVTLEFMDSGRRHTVTVHESALEPKHTGPIDPTQTYNYYQPVDTRRFYLALKHSEPVVREMGLAGITRANAAHYMDAIGSTFNQLWKPAVLFRFGWPMRVLMDENMRALSVLGIPAFAHSYGSAYAKGLNNAFVRTGEAVHNRFNALIRDPIVAHRTGRKAMDIGPGPLAQQQRYHYDPIERDAAILNTPKLPDSFLPALDASRYERVAAALAEWDGYERFVNKARAWEREPAPEGELNEIQRRARESGMEALARVNEGLDVPETPMRRIINRRADGSTFDPITGRTERSGFVVPLSHTKARLDGDRDLMEWYRAHRELLGSTGYRVHLDEDGSISVARLFGTQKNQREKAAAFAQFVDGPMVNLRTGVSARFELGGSPFYDEAAVMDHEFDLAYRANGELRAQEVAVENLDPDVEFDADLDHLHSVVRKAVLRRRPLSKGTRKATSSDGRVFEYPDAFEGHKGELMRSMIGSQGAMEMLSEGHGAATNLLRRLAVGHKAYQPPTMTDAARTKGTPENRKAVEYFHQWSNLLNGQIAHSPIWSKMLNGWRDDDIVDWLDNTPEGARVRRELKGKYSNTELWVNEHRAKLDYYLPNRKLQRLLGKERLQPSQLRREIIEEEYPSVFGPDVEFLTRAGVGQTASWVADHIWHALGTVPIDTLSRHPFARSMYDLRMKSLINSTDAKWLDDKMLQRFETEARKFTREQVRKTLWDLVDQTNFTDALRFIAPFWGAQSEAIVKWGKIVSDRPETIARAFALNNAVYQNFVTVNEEGELVERDRFDYSPTDRVIMRIPESMRKGPLGQALETIGTVGIPIGSANTVLQGETPLLPGPGPMLTIPADKFLRATSETLGAEFDEAFLYKWLFPIGRPQHGGFHGVLEQVSPGWGRRVMQLAEGDGGISYSNTMAEVAREMELENRRKGLPAPSPEQVREQARWVFGLRIFAGLVSPVQTQFRPKHQFFIDEARRYQKEQGLDWFDKFIDKYGVAMARYTASSSKATVGTPPTTEGLQEWAEHQPLIAKFPEWGEAMISPDAYDAEFSGDAYYAQFELNVGPGDDTPLREGQSLRERFASADARAGWYEFRKVDAILDVQLEQRGLTSLQQNGAEDLAQMKANFIADLTQRNKAWREEYDSFTNDIYTRVDELQSWAFKPDFDQRPDIQGVRQYLMLRDQVAAELDRYAATTGGSRSLQAEENGPLRDWFYQQVGGIAQANPAFAEFYGRYLSQDTLSQGSGGF